MFGLRKTLEPVQKSQDKKRMRNLRPSGRDQSKVTERRKGKNRMKTWVSRIHGQMEVSRKRKRTITPTL